MEEIPIDKNFLDEKKIINKGFLPGNRRIMILGKSNCGKSYSLLHIIPALNIDEIYVICPTVNQPVYQAIEKYCKENRIKLTYFKDTNNISKILLNKKIDKQKHKLVIIDDIYDKKQLEELCPLFSHGRHYNYSIIIISQSFSNCPIEIRKNLSDLLMFHTDNIQHVYCSKLKSYFKNNNEFHKIYNDAINEPFGYLNICLDSDCRDILKIRCKLNGVLENYLAIKI